MAGYLLGYDALIDFLEATDTRGAATPVMAWTKKLTDPIHISEMTWATVRGKAEGEGPLNRQRWLDKLDRDVLSQFGTRLLTVNRNVLRQYSLLYSHIRELQGAMDDDTGIPLEEAIEVATALQRDLVYVSRGSDLATVAGCKVFWP